MSNLSTTKILGRYAKVQIQGIGGLKQTIIAKVDTGAYTSSVHAENIKLKGGILHFTIGGMDFSADSFAHKLVRSSNGHCQKRYIVSMKAKIGRNTYVFDVSLANRSQMRHEMLLGHLFLKDNQILVDVNKDHRAILKEKSLA